jgi:hypothetical protein
VERQGDGVVVDLARKKGKPTTGGKADEVLKTPTTATTTAEAAAPDTKTTERALLGGSDSSDLEEGIFGGEAFLEHMIDSLLTKVHFCVFITRLS